MKRHLFFASTPFNMLTASMVALSLPESDEKLLCLIDQPKNDSIFVKAILSWPETPFHKTVVGSRKVQRKSKLKQRKVDLDILNALLDQFKPTSIYTGNDRRIEFQFSMAHTSSKVKGIYIDDGTYTYLGRQTHWFKDQIVDNLAKKIIYGRWWKQPKTIGASDWIEDCIVAFPDFIAEPLKNKKVSLLPLNLEHNSFKQLSKQCLKNNCCLSETLSLLDVLILYPHESVLTEKMSKNIKEHLNLSQGVIAVKHHPRSINNAITSNKDIVELPQTIPIEVLLPLISGQCKVIGDLSTALLTTKWLRPDIEVSTFMTKPVDNRWLQLLNTLNIKTI